MGEGGLVKNISHFCGAKEVKSPTAHASTCVKETATLTAVWASDSAAPAGCCVAQCLHLGNGLSIGERRGGVHQVKLIFFPFPHSPIGRLA